ncbi:MAG: helix-turn-helix transcriptional regulator [Candidatus Gastranaerophilales bacterium]|nr:helix-turn-helix transcriptional regulator [Candidatus Gastranaerophilales bacterium]
MQAKDKKKIILNALASVMKDLRGKKSQFMFASENDISISIISTAERGLKDPQLTTLFKLAEAFDISIADFISLINSKLPQDFHFIEK